MRRIVLELIEKVLESQNSLNPDENLVDQGLDSIKTIQFIVQLEEKIGITIADDDLLMENFDRIEKIISLIDKNLVK
ncbi:acyl carrier protein [Paenibacillus woosongensis]|nr:acyl carrier protein [Paenibacillus woosongensis]